MGGSHHTVCPYSYSFTDLFNINNGASHRHIFPVDNWENSLTVIPTGISGQPASKFYCNQTEMYINNQYHKDLYTRKSVEENSIFKMIIKK